MWLIINALEFHLSFYKHLITKTAVNKHLLLFFLALGLSTVYGFDPYISHGVLFERYLGYILFFCLGSYLVKNTRNVTILIGAIIFAGILIGVGGIWGHLQLGTADRFHLVQGRMHSSFGRVISFARFLVLYIPLSSSILFFSRNKILRIGAFISLIVLFPCLIFNAARAGLAAVMVVILMVSFLKNKKVFLLSLIFFCTLLLFPVFGIKERALTTFNPLTWGERVPLWEIAIKIFKDYPIFGAGLGISEKLLPEYWQPSSLFAVFRMWDIHNTYLELLAEAGIVGLGTFLWIFARFFKNAFKTVKNMVGEQQALALGLIGAVSAALIFALSASNITAGVQETAVFWFLFGIAVSLNSGKEQIKTV
ncbi:MAG: O-antigen ligase family protein [Candidatus Omnitrophica bacterium]|nr:O-antigen ligase family protein [Candidatus Omnitrophota bacterium]MBU1924732.1 O-antigen ligase family protein [Candidatus Omnitrophota bacterium]